MNDENWEQYAKALEENPEPLTADDKLRLLKEVSFGQVLPDSVVEKLKKVANDNLEQSRER